MAEPGRRSMLLLLSLVLTASCDRGSLQPTARVPFPVARLVDSAASGDRSRLAGVVYDLYRRLGGRRPLRTAQLPRATIADDTRYVLVGPPTWTAAVKLSDYPQAGAASVTVPLPDTFERSTRALVRVATRSGKTWSPSTYVTLPVRPDADRRPTLSLARRSSGAAATAPIEEISFTALGESADLALHRTSPLRIAAGAELRFGTGVLTGDESGATVTFMLDACTDGDCSQIYRDTILTARARSEHWRDHSVSLAAVAGSEVSFEFRATVEGPAPDALVLPVWANPTVYAPVGTQRPNVILISLDTLRADHLPTYGYSRDTAPFLEETFGRNGTVLADCTSASASTPPGHMTIMTSLDPSVHAVRRGDETLDASIATLAEVLRADGVTTGAVTEDGWLGHGQGFDRGFDSYAEDRVLDIASPQGAIERTLSTSLAWLARHRDTPFFLFVHTYQVHDPYAPPLRYANLFSGPGVLDSDSLRYDQEIRYTDDRLREFFATLGELVDMDNTLVVITSDHGEGFLEHGYTLHSAFLYQEITHVPCMFWGAGVPSGQRVSAPTGTIDLAPTIVRLAGAPIPHQFAGIDVTRLFTGDDPDLDARLRSRQLFSEAWGDFAVEGEHREASAVIAPVLAVRRDRLKVMRTAVPGAVRYQAYDLFTDPGERNDLLTPEGSPRDMDAATAASLGELRAALDSYLDESKKARARLLGVSVADLPPDRPAVSAVAPDTENKLRALGYLE